MKFFKSKWTYILLIVILSIVSTVGLYFLKRYLSSDIKDFTSDIIAVFALTTAIGFPLYKELFPKKPLMEYGVSPLTLDYFNGYKYRIKVRIINSGEVDINIQFQWIKFAGQYLTHKITMNEKKGVIDSSIVLPAGRQRDFYLEFLNPNYYTNNTSIKYHRLKKHSHNLERYRNVQAKLTWFDVSLRMKQINIPLGAWYVEYLIDIMKRDLRRD